MSPLELWLSAATGGLSEESAAQVRTEIEQHYESACEAGADAIAALGDPRIANRAYRKVLLTEREAMMAPSLTQPQKPHVWVLILASCFVWFVSRNNPGPESLATMVAIYSFVPLAWFFPATTLERCRIHSYFLAVRSLLIVGVAAWNGEWITGLSLGAILFLVHYFPQQTRTSVLRKLAAGQRYSLLPEEPELTRGEAITLSTLRKDPELREDLAGGALLAMITGLAIWQPAIFLSSAVFVFAAHVTRRVVPFQTEAQSRWFRIAKWTAMATVALTPFLLRARAPWFGAYFMVLLFVLFDLRSISLRLKLPVSQWPKRLYW